MKSCTLPRVSRPTLFATSMSLASVSLGLAFLSLLMRSDRRNRSRGDDHEQVRIEPVIIEVERPVPQRPRSHAKLPRSEKLRQDADERDHLVRELYRSSVQQLRSTGNDPYEYPQVERVRSKIRAS
jgi:hypothetical protein